MSETAPAKNPNSMRAGADTAVRVWLICVACLVFAMVIVGGATRLTDSGLSITEWLPILGAIPPLSDADWRDVFEKYKMIPEYAQVNQGMSLAAFQFIYWWEWSHRFLGRFIGVAFALPLLFFWITGKLREGLGLKLLGVLALGALQGFIGWYMVMSGLVDRVDVSHYRLALHLITAFLILALLVWLALSLGPQRQLLSVRKPPSAGQRNTVKFLLALVFAQVILGAFVAGTKAGLGYNTWPLMDGQFFPDGYWERSPWYMNLLENVTAIQFNHRFVAYFLMGLALWHAVSLTRTSDDKRVIFSSFILVLAFLTQAVLGISTLLMVPDAGGIPLTLGLAHQGGAAVVTVVAVWHLFGVTHGPKV